MQFIAVDEMRPPKDETMHVSISRQGMMNILKPQSNIHLKNQFVRFYIEPLKKNILAWTFHESVPLNTMKDYKQIKQTKQGVLCVCAAKAIGMMGKSKKSFTNLPVKLHIEKSILDGEVKYNYIELK